MDAAWDPRHPAVAAALSTVESGQVLPVRGVVIREPAAAVLLADDRTRRAVILTLVSGAWTPPTMVCGGNWSPADRPAQTRAPWALAQPATSQSRPPGPDGAPPAAVWTALSGLTAADAVSVLVRSTLDEHEVRVPGDGVVLALLRAPWGGRLEITVRTQDGSVRHIAP
jgi:hypothetical protein